MSCGVGGASGRRTRKAEGVQRRGQGGQMEGNGGQRKVTESWRRIKEGLQTQHNEGLLTLSKMRLRLPLWSLAPRHTEDLFKRPLPSGPSALPLDGGRQRGNDLHRYPSSSRLLQQLPGPRTRRGNLTSSRTDASLAFGGGLYRRTRGPGTDSHVGRPSSE